jgi:hypothetical protein
MSSVVTVWSSWGDYVLAVRQLRSGDSLSAPRIWFESGVARLEDEPLRDGQRVELMLGGVRHRVSCEQAEVARFPRRRLEPWLPAAAALVIALSVLGSSSPWRAQPREREPARAGASGRAPLPVTKEAPEHEAVFAVAAEPQARELLVTGTARCGDAQMGLAYAEPRDRRYGLAGPRDNPDPHLARFGDETGEAQVPMRLTQLGEPQRLPGRRAPAAAFGRDTSLGSDAQDALGGVWGERLGDDVGEHGLGRRAIPGGIAKRIDVAALVGAPEQGTRVLHTGLRVSGERKMSEVGRGLAASFEGFRRCAERSTPREPRHVELVLEIAADGSATGGGVAGALGQCLAERVQGVSFGAGGVARVIYPLSIVPATSGLRAGARRAATPAACDCGG